MHEFNLLISPMEEEFKKFFQKTKDNLFIVTPFIKNYGATLLLDSVSKNLYIKILTNLDILNILTKAFDFEALRQLINYFKKIEIISISRLHAKLYISDNVSAILTSANLTKGGMLENKEYGILIERADLVKTFLKDMGAYAELGNNLSIKLLNDLENDI